MPRKDTAADPSSPSFDGYYDELFMNKKKLETIENWFQSIVAKNWKQKILLVYGPTGSGKTFTIRAFARKYDIHIRTSIFERDDIKTLALKSKYGCLDFHDTDELKQSILLLDNFSCEKCRSGSLATILSSNIPCAMIITDPISLEPSISKWLQDFFSAPSVCQVEVNPYPKTVLKKALSYSFNHVSEECIQNCSGDMRAAWISHYMLSLVHESAENVITKFACDTTIGLFHNLGKFLYPRKTAEVYDVTQMWSDDLELFNFYLYHNMASNSWTIKNIYQALANFSYTDVIVSSTYKLPDHWKRQHLSIPSRSISYIVTAQVKARIGRFSLTKPSIFSHSQKGKKATWIFD